jgi:predicted MFS family arabinose efflux permease
MSRGGKRLPPVAALVVAAAVFLIVGGNNLLMPLYPAYGAVSGTGTAAITLAFSFYALGMIPVLILLGGVSDRIGRKLPLVVALIMTWVATAAVTAWPGIAALAAARLLQGAAMGLMAGSATAWLAELLPGEKAARQAGSWVAAMMTLGFALTPLATGAALMTSDTLRPASYWIHLAGTLLCLGAVGRLAYLPMPQETRWVRLPRLPRTVWLYAFANFCSWAAIGVTLAVVPAELNRHGLAAWAGFAAFLFNGAAFLSQSISRRLVSETNITVGIVLVPTGYAVLGLGAWGGDIALILLGAATTGAGAMGFVFPGGLSGVSQAAPADRAGAITGFFLCCYLGFCLPTCVAGLAADFLGLPAALGLFGVVLSVAASCSAVGAIRQTRAASRVPPASQAMRRSAA